MKRIQAVILCGGKGTRLRELYSDIPKALVPVSGKPLLQWQIELLVANGVNTIHLAAGHLADKIDDWQHQLELDADISLSTEPSPLGTGGGLKYVEPFIKTNPFICMNGDSLMPNLDFEALLTLHNESDTKATLAATRINDSGRYGTVVFNDNHQVTAFLEKTERSEGWINGGVYVMNSSILGTIAKDQSVSLENEVFPALAAENNLKAFLASPPLLDMGTPEGLRNTEAFLQK